MHSNVKIIVLISTFIKYTTRRDGDKIIHREILQSRRNLIIRKREKGESSPQRRSVSSPRESTLSVHVDFFQYRNKFLLFY